MIQFILLLFLFIKTIICKGAIFDIGTASIDIYEEENSMSWQISYNNSIYSLLKNEFLTIFGETSTNTIFIHGNGKTNQAKLNIILDKYTFLDDNTEENDIYPFYFEGIKYKSIYISLENSAEISIHKSAFYISDDCENCSLTIEGSKSNTILNIYPSSSTTNSFLINSNNHIFLRNLQLLSYPHKKMKKVKKLTISQNHKISQDTKPIITNGIIGETVKIEDCTIIIESKSISIGGPNISSIQIISSMINLKSESSTCLGSSSDELLDIEIINSTVNANSNKDGSSIGSIQKDSGHLIIEKSKITAQSSGQFFSTIGFFSQIDITQSYVSAYALKGLCGIGGSASKTWDSEIEINIKSSTVSSYASGNSASIGCSDLMTSTIIIFNSTVSTTNSNVNGHSGSGIGGADRSRVRLIEIIKSNVTCLTNGNGSPIGSGGNSGHFTLIRICNMSNITCENRGSDQQSSAGIGGFCGGDIEILDSYVKTTSGDDGAGIGGSRGQSIGSIRIERSFINSSSKEKGAAIGASSGGFVKNGIFILNSTVFAFSGIHGGFSHGAAIGGGLNTDGGIIVIKKSNITAIAGFYGSSAAIGGGFMGGPGKIHITESYVYAQSAINGAMRAWEFNAGSAIGAGGTAIGSSSDDFLKEGGTIEIINSIVIAKGGSTINSTIKKFQLEAGAAIGFGGTTIYPQNSINISISNNSIVYAYGGNATDPKNAAAPAIGGGGRFNDIHQFTILVDDSFVMSVSGYNEENRRRGNSNFGYSWNPHFESNEINNNNNMTGEFTIRGKSTVITSHSIFDNVTSPVILDSFTIEGSNANIELHSTNASCLAVNKLNTNGSYLFTLSKIEILKMSEIRIQKEIEDDRKSEQFQKKIIVLGNDRSVTFTVPNPGTYHVYATIDGVEEEIENHDGKPFFIESGNNVFDNFLIKNHESSFSSQIVTITKSLSLSNSPFQSPFISESNEDGDFDIDISKDKKKNLPLILGLCIGIPTAVILIVIIVVLIYKYKKSPPITESVLSTDLKEKLVTQQAEQL